MLSALIAYGAMLGSMNLLIYQAFARLPIGIATGIEVLGPLMVVLCGSRSRRDIVWFVAAVIGLVLLLPLRSGAALDPIGLVLQAARRPAGRSTLFMGSAFPAHSVGMRSLGE